jgi:hypothetical protein
MGLVDPLSEFFARLEVRHAFCGYRDKLTRFGVTPDAGGATIHGKRTKPPDLDTLSPHQSRGQRVKKHPYRDLAVSLTKLRRLAPADIIETLCKPLYEFGPGHCREK